MPSASFIAHCQKLLSVGLVMLFITYNFNVCFREHDLDHDLTNFIIFQQHRLNNRQISVSDFSSNQHRTHSKQRLASDLETYFNCRK